MSNVLKDMSDVGYKGVFYLLHSYLWAITNKKYSEKIQVVLETIIKSDNLKKANENKFVEIFGDSLNEYSTIISALIKDGHIIYSKDPQSKFATYVYVSSSGFLMLWICKNRISIFFWIVFMFFISQFLINILFLKTFF